MKVNFELATPNSVHGCTLARPTWRRMKKGAGVHCARAVHVQMFCTCSSFAAPTGHTVRAADANLQVTCMLPQHICFCGYRSFQVQAARARTGKSLFGRGPPVLGNFDLLTPNLVHLWNSMSVIRWYMSFRDRVHSARAMHVHNVYA